MSNKANGGAAFPGFDYYRSKPLPPEAEGMSLRDFLAAKAMQSVPLALDDNEQQLIANASYRMADAMLRAREAS